MEPVLICPQLSAISGQLSVERRYLASLPDSGATQDFLDLPSAI